MSLWFWKLFLKCQCDLESFMFAFSKGLDLSLLVTRFFCKRLFDCFVHWSNRHGVTLGDLTELVVLGWEFSGECSLLGRMTLRNWKVFIPLDRYSESGSKRYSYLKVTGNVLDEWDALKCLCYIINSVCSFPLGCVGVSLCVCVTHKEQ